MLIKMPVNFPKQYLQCILEITTFIIQNNKGSLKNFNLTTVMAKMISKQLTAILPVKLVSDLMNFNVCPVSRVHHEYSNVRLIHVLAVWDMLIVESGNALAKIVQ